MDPVGKGSNDLSNPVDSTQAASYPADALGEVFSLLESNKDRNSVSLVCKAWYNAERLSRRKVFVGNCCSVTPEIVARRFPNIRSVTLKGTPVGDDFHSWLVVFAEFYPFLEELWLKKMVISDESLEFLAKSFPDLKVLSLSSCSGFSTDGLKPIATHCKNLTVLDVQENDIYDMGGEWLSCFPETFVSLEVLKFSDLNSDVAFDALERLVDRCKALRVLMVNKLVSLEQIGKLLLRAPQLRELGTGSFEQRLVPNQFAELKTAFSRCKNLHTLSGLWEVSLVYVPVLYPVCANLTYLNLSYGTLERDVFTKLLSNCSNLRRLWVLDTVGDKALEAVGSSCPLLEELRVFSADPFYYHGFRKVTESGLVAVSKGCRKLHYVLYFCKQMTNAAVATIVTNCPDITHFRLHIIKKPDEKNYMKHELMDEAIGAVVKTCKKLQRLSVSGFLTDQTFEYIGKYAKNLETLSVHFASGSSDLGMESLMKCCPKLRKLEIRNCPFGDAALLSGLEKYESMRSLWMSACNVTMKGCRLLADFMPRLNVEVIKDKRSGESSAGKVFVYRSVAGPRRDARPFTL